MAEVHILPAGLDPVVLSRTCEVLRRSFEAGDDLGDRAPDIRMLGSSLEAAQRDVRRQIAIIRDLPPMPPGIDVGALAQAFEAWVDALAMCAAVIDRASLARDEGHGRAQHEPARQRALP